MDAARRARLRAIPTLHVRQRATRNRCRSSQGLGQKQGMNDTIFALSSAPGRAGVAVIRVSGPSANTCLSVLSDKKLPAARKATLRTLRGADGNAIDQAIVLRFEHPA